MSIPPTSMQALSENPLLGPLTSSQSEILSTYLESITLAPGTIIVREGNGGRDMYFVIEGRCALERQGIRLSTITPGGHLGELALFSNRPRAASATAIDQVQLARLTRENWERLSNEQPTIALALLKHLVKQLGKQLVHVTDSVGSLLKERSLPRRTTVNLIVDDLPINVAMGTPLKDIVPCDTQKCCCVVAALFDHKPVSLNTPVSADGRVAALTTESWEGREIYRRSAGLLLLEAARTIAPELRVRIGVSLSSVQLVYVDECNNYIEFAQRLQNEMNRLIEQDVPFVEEIWTVEEAMSHFDSRGWTDATELLRSRRDPTVPLVTCGSTYALSLAPCLPSTAILRDLKVSAHASGLLLEFGEPILSMIPKGLREADLLGRLHPSTSSRSPEMTVSHTSWLTTMGVTSVGAYNERCISSQVTELVRVAEGFHEKRIGHIADQIRDRGKNLRVICIAGPSSSGKTTFIKRLIVQLRINGLQPHEVSLDNYYVNRENTPRDEHGEYDYEALEAIDRGLFQSQLEKLLHGESTHLAKYDFLTGRSLPSGGPIMQLHNGNVLLIEGIHGLNPALFDGTVQPSQIFRIFIHPILSLPFDRLSVVSPADLRLLRRIVRDRHQRGCNAADNIARWPSVREGERKHIFPFLPLADVVFDSALVYEPSVIKVYAERYLLEVPRNHPSYTTAYRLRRLIDRFVAIYPDHVPPTSILREFIGGSGFEY